MNGSGAAPPLVSIIVPSYNQGQFLRATLDSILSQDYRPLQVLVMDGASKDDSVAILRDYAARHPELSWISEPDGGPADAVNKGLARAEGAIAGIQSSDDVYLPGAISAAVAALQAHPEAGIVYGDAYLIDEHDRQISQPTHWPAWTMERFLSMETFVLQSSAFFRTPLARELGGWDRRYFACDVELWLRMMFRAPALKVDAVWSAFRRHEAQRDKQTRKIFESWWRVIDESADLKTAPPRLRRAAGAGRRLIVQHYNPGSPWFRAGQLWLAILSYPPALRGLQHPAMLLPGLGRINRRLRGWLGRGSADIATGAP